jgi:hypothetical protein
VALSVLCGDLAGEDTTPAPWTRTAIEGGHPLTHSRARSPRLLPQVPGEGARRLGKASSAPRGAPGQRACGAEPSLAIRRDGRSLARSRRPTAPRHAGPDER